MEDQTAQKVSNQVSESSSCKLSSGQIQDRIRGAVLGAACANSLGGSCVGVNYKEIITSAGISRLRDYAPGLSKSSLPNHKPGAILADSMLAISLGNALLTNSGRLNVEGVKEAYSQLLETDEFLKAGPGAVCLAGIRRFVDGLAPLTDTAEALHANAAARAFICGCLPGQPKSEEAVEAAAHQAAFTHADKRSMSAAAVVADSVRFFIEGTRLEQEADVREYVRREFEVANRFDPRFAESWDDVAPDLDYAKPAEDLPYSLINVESNVNELVPTAVGIFLIFRHSLEEAICAAARSGGDTDTVSTIVGAMSGAYHGASQIPERWLFELSHKEELESLAQGLGKLWS